MITQTGPVSSSLRPTIKTFSFTENGNVNNSARVDVFYMSGLNLLDQHRSEQLECYRAFPPHISILLIIYVVNSSFMWKHSVLKSESRSPPSLPHNNNRISISGEAEPSTGVSWMLMWAAVDQTRRVNDWVVDEWGDEEEETDNSVSMATGVQWSAWRRAHYYSIKGI